MSEMTAYINALEKAELKIRQLETHRNSLLTDLASSLEREDKLKESNDFAWRNTRAIDAARMEVGPVAYIYTTDQGKGKAHLSYSRPELQDQDALADQEIVIDRLYKLPEDTP